MKKFGDLKKRLIVSIAMIVAIGALIFFSNMFLMGFFTAIAVGVLAYFAVLEYIFLVKRKSIHISKPILLGGVICQILSFYLFSIYRELAVLPVSIFVFFMFYLFISNFKDIPDSILRISTTALGFIYLALPLGLIFPILNINFFGMQDGRFWIFYLIFVSKASDIAAYFGGRLFGKSKLAPKLSPKKTIFGSVCGALASVGVSLLFLNFVSQNVFHINWLQALILGFILGAFSQIGDLSESLLKRDAKVKDASSLPGVGGVLDMIDSLLFNIPILYIFLLG